MIEHVLSLNGQGCFYLNKYNILTDILAVIVLELPEIKQGYIHAVLLTDGFMIMCISCCLSGLINLRQVSRKFR